MGWGAPGWGALPREIELGWGRLQEATSGRDSKSWQTLYPADSPGRFRGGGGMSEIPTWPDFLPGPPSSVGPGHGPGRRRPRRVGGASWAQRARRSGRRGDSSPGGPAARCAGGDMEDGVLKEGFLVKRVSAPEHLRTLRAAGGRAPAHLSRAPSLRLTADPAAWGSAGQSSCWWREPVDGGWRSASNRREGPGHRQAGESCLAGA